MPSVAMSFSPENGSFSLPSVAARAADFAPLQFVPALFRASQGFLHEKILGPPWAKFWSGPCYGRFGSMRIFVLASPSISVVTASNSLNNVPAKSNTPDNKPADGSPFAAMLAATTTQPAKPQAANPVSQDHNSDAASSETGASATGDGAKAQASGDGPSAQTAQTKNSPAKTSASGAGAA